MCYSCCDRANRSNRYLTLFNDNMLSMLALRLADPLIRPPCRVCNFPMKISTTAQPGAPSRGSGFHLFSDAVCQISGPAVASFERFRLAASLEASGAMSEKDAKKPGVAPLSSVVTAGAGPAARSVFTVTRSNCRVRAPGRRERCRRAGSKVCRRLARRGGPGARYRLGAFPDCHHCLS